MAWISTCCHRCYLHSCFLHACNCKLVHRGTNPLPCVIGVDSIESDLSHFCIDIHV